MSQTAVDEPRRLLVDVESQCLTRYRNAAQGVYTLVDEPDLAAPLAVAGLWGVLAERDGLFTY